MKTAEEYISDIRLKSALVDAPVGWFDEGQIAKIMLEYAQQEAIEFISWAMREGFEWISKDEMFVNDSIYPGANWTTEELYKIWKDEDNQ